MSTGEVSESEADVLMAAGWVPSEVGIFILWLHRVHAPVLGVPTKRALELQRAAIERGYVKVVGFVNEAVMARLRAPFTCELIQAPASFPGPGPLGRWRIADANDDAIASCSAAEEGYARLICQALNEHFERKGSR
jgi:hypothetical protein